MFIGIFIYLPLFLTMWLSGKVEYTWMQILFCNVNRLFLTSSLIMTTKAIDYGDGGPLQAIENQKSAVTTIFMALLFDIYPNLYEIAGLLAGLVAIPIIVC